MASPAPRYRNNHADPSTPRSYMSASTSMSVDSGPYTPQQPFSVSDTRPFDWAAARGERPAPYGASPANRLPAPGRRKGRNSNPTGDRPKVVRRASWLSRTIDYPAQLWLDISMMPSDWDFLQSKVVGRWLGVSCHAIHCVVAYAQRPRRTGLDELGDDWGDLRSEIRGSGGPSSDFDDDNGFGWAWLFGWLVFIISIVNVLWVFTRFKPYWMHTRTDVVKSPNAKVVKKDLNLEYKPDPPLIQWIFAVIGRQIRDSFRFLIGSTPQEDELDDVQANVVRLDAWEPGELELALFTVYSPVHSMLYGVWGWTTWLRVPVLMVVLTAMLNALVSWYQQLIKDNKTIAAEVMSEYNQKYVFPRVNPVRRDACVMTNEAETVDFMPMRRAAARTSLAQPKTWQQIQSARVKQQENGHSSPRVRQSAGGGGLLKF